MPNGANEVFSRVQINKAPEFSGRGSLNKTECCLDFSLHGGSTLGAHLLDATFHHLLTA